MKLWQYTFLFTLFQLPAQGQFPDCLLSFAAFTSPSADPVALTVSTYERLLDSLGRNLGPEALRELAASKDPFLLPEKFPGVEALRRRLSELKDMVNRRGWETPPVMTALAESLNRRAVQQQGGRALLETAKLSAGRDTKLVTEERYQPVTVSPDSRWLITAKTEEGHTTSSLVEMRVVNLESKASQQSASPRPIPRFSGRLSFSPTGDEVWLFLESGHTWAVPFAEGTLQWDRGHQRGKSTTGFGVKPSPAGFNPRFQFGAIRQGQTVVRHDSQTDLGQSITIPETRGTVWKPTMAGSPPGSEKLLVVKDGQGYGGKIDTYDIDAQGLATNAQTIAQWKTRTAARHVSWLPNGNLLTVFGATFYEWTAPDVAKTLFEARGKHPAGKAGGVVGFYSHREYAVALFSNAGGECWVEFGDLKTGKTLGVIDVPNHTNDITFLPDGSAFVARGFRDIQVVGYHGHLTPPP